MATAPIPLKTQIVDQAGAITVFFRQRWEELRQQILGVAARGIFSVAGKNAAIAGQVIYTVQTAGLYRVTFTARRTTADGVASTLTFTWHYTDGGTPVSPAEAVNGTDSTGSLYTASRLFPADANSNLTFDMAYTSNTPGQMVYKVSVTAEQVTQA